MNSIRPGARAMISGARAWMARNFAMRASVIGSAKGTKARARLEAHKFHRRDLHRPAGVRVESIPGGALRHRERPKPGEMHLGVPPEAPLDRPQYAARGAFGRSLRRAFAEQSMHLVHQFRLVHELSLPARQWARDRKSTRLNSSHLGISYAVFC